MVSATGTVCHEVQAEVLGTWSTAVPYWRSGRRVESTHGQFRLDGRWSWLHGTELATAGTVDRDGHGHAASLRPQTGDVTHAFMAGDGVFEPGRSGPGPDLGLIVDRTLRHHRQENRSVGVRVPPGSQSSAPGFA